MGPYEGAASPSSPPADDFDFLSSSAITTRGESYEDNIGYSEAPFWDADGDEDDEEGHDSISAHVQQLGFYELSLQTVQPSSSAHGAKQSKKQIAPTPGAVTTTLTQLATKKSKDEPVEIIPGLFIGSESHAKHEYLLKRLGITHVIAIHDKAQRHFPHTFDYLLIAIKDKPLVDVASHFADAHSFIRKALSNKGTVLVHCWAGVSRSATIVVSYMMQQDKLTFHEALRRVSDAKPDISPNPGFIHQLQQYEKQLNLTNTGSSNGQTLAKNPKGVNGPRKYITISSPPRKSEKRTTKIKKHRVEPELPPS